MVHMTFQHTLTYGLLSLALIALWFPPKTPKPIPVRLWHILSVVALGCGMVFGNVQLPGLFAIVILRITCYCTTVEHYATSVRIIAGTIMFALSLCLLLHVVPGFLNPKIVTDVIVSKGGIPYSQHLNFDKTFVGLFILGFTCRNLLSKPQAWWSMIKQAAPFLSPQLVCFCFCR